MQHQRPNHLKQWLRVAWRNVARQKKRTALLAGAIAFAVLVITLVNAYTAGLVVAVRENFTQSFGGHVYVSGSVISERGREMNLLRDTALLERAIDEVDIDVATINYRSGALATLIYTTNEAIQVVDGVDFAAEARFRETVRLVGGSWEALAEPGSILLPQSAVDQLGMELGEELLLSLSTVTGQRNVVELTLRGISSEVAGLGITSAYVRLADMNAALGLAPGEYQTANLYLEDPAGIDAATVALERELARTASVDADEAADAETGVPASLFGRLFGGGGAEVAPDERWEGTRFAVTNLNDATEQLETIVGTMNAVAFGIFVVLLVISGVGITNSYRMVMIERTGEIGTMRSIGVPRRGIRSIFTLEALLVAMIGTAAGVLIALLVAGGVGLVEWSAGTALDAFLLKGRLIADVRLTAIARNAAIILLMTVWAVSAPAKAAARLEPAQALRTTN